MSTPDVNGEMTVTEAEWPFTRPELMAGLRRYLAASSLRLLNINAMALPDTMPGQSPTQAGTKLSGMSVNVLIDGEEQNLPLVLKEPPMTQDGRVLRAVGQREYGVYRRLAPLLPLLVPGLVAGDESSGWIILEVLTGLRAAPDWTVDDYQEAIGNLVRMHDRFWALDEILSTYPWLARPLGADYDLTVAAARDAATMLLHADTLPQLVAYRGLFPLLVDAADEITAPLRREDSTLIHGDYWPGNIARPLDGRQIVFDWQMAGIGPAILDLVGFVQSTNLYLQPALSASEMIASYRAQLDPLAHITWEDGDFDLLWDHALMWLFMTKWLGRLATMHPENYTAIEDRFRATWLDMVLAAAERRLHK
ncbi:MAG: aminoglycoside phosphotransferase family protein [Anaerolineae bacterium]|nr:aminoglycoside phosphotransferase family protein [Anaerolineae bacterium]